MVGFCTGFGRILQMLVNAKAVLTRRRKGAETQSREGGPIRKAGREEAKEVGKRDRFCGALGQRVLPGILLAQERARHTSRFCTRLLYHGFLRLLRCGQYECDRSGQEWTRVDWSGHFLVRFLLDGFSINQEARVGIARSAGKEPVCPSPLIPLPRGEGQAFRKSVVALSIVRF